MLAIAAHIPSSEIGIDYFQATHPENLFKDCSHYVELVSKRAQAPRIFERAIRTAIGSRGVGGRGDPGRRGTGSDRRHAAGDGWYPLPRSCVPQGVDLDRLAELLNRGSRVTLLCGAGCAGAHDEVIALAKMLQSPIVHPLRGKEHVEYDNPYDVGMTGLIGFASGYLAMKACDTLLMLGTDFPYRQFYPEAAKIAQIDLRAEALGNRCKLDLGLVGDVKDDADGAAARSTRA